MKLTLKRKKGDDEAANDGAPREAPLRQGINARGNILHRIALVALIVAMLPLLLGFAYLMFVHNPALEQQQVAQVSAAYAEQQATNIGRTLSRLKSRLTSAASTPAAWSVIERASTEEIAGLEEALLAYFPEAARLRVLPIGDLGTATFSSEEFGLRSHIEVDMVRRSSEAKEVYPESYKFEEQWYTALVSRVTHPQVSERAAVILLTIDNAHLSSQLESIHSGSGAFALAQTHVGPSGSGSSQEVASAGAAEGGQSFSSDIPNTYWRVTFTPSAGLIEALSVDRTPLLGALVTALTACLVGMALLVYRFPRALNAELDNIIAAADRRTGLDLGVPELVTIAKQLRRATLRNMRQGDAPATARSQAPAGEAKTDVLASPKETFINPMYQTEGILVEEVEETEGLMNLDLDIEDEPAQERAVASDIDLPGHIFRAYDIRGDAKGELSDALVTKIGKAVGTIAGQQGEQTLVVGCDGRASSPRIKAALVRALMETGRDIVDIGLVPTPLLYFATRHLEYRSGIMVTGSHNPAQDNGLKIVLNQQTIAAGGIQDIRQCVAAGEFESGNGRLVREDVVPAYVKEVVQDIAIAVPLKVVIDAGNGATGEIAPELFRELGCEVVPLYCKIDGSFPNHPPDTSNEDNLADLARTVVEAEADLGVAFDGDGDRLAVVTSSGRIVRTDNLLMLYAQDVVSRNPGADVVFDVKCSRNLTQLITQHGGRPVLWKTGHAFMKEKMRETGALLGGEFSGHIFFGERWFGFDDGMYAAARLAEIMSTQGDSLDDTIDNFPATVNTPEIIIPVADDYKFELIERIVEEADFSTGKVNTLDGIRVDFKDGWGLVRASNTGPALTARFEADTAEHLAIIQEEFREQISLVDPSVELGF